MQNAASPPSDSMEIPYWVGISPWFALIRGPRVITVLGQLWEEVQVAPPDGTLESNDGIWLALMDQGFHFTFSIPQILILDEEQRLHATGGRVYYFRRKVPNGENI